MQTIHTIGEVGLIERLRRRLSHDLSVIVGIGDDAAVLQTPKHGRLLFASDMLVEGVHFIRRQLPARWIGWKALACNVSDIAAMGGVPHWAVVSLGLPPKTPIRFVDQLYSGFLAGHFESILKEWRAFASFLGRRVRVVIEGRMVDGQAVDIDPSGSLLVRTDAGLMELVSAGEVLLVR